MAQQHPFDRYAAYTDLEQLLAFSAKPLRKSLRVNTLKMPIDELVRRASTKEWELSPVPWAPEAFFVDREDRSKGLGKDLLHLLGHFYLQEAASMLPVALLDPQPGETVLDMSAAPGSKTTQIAARMKGTGVIIANDVQEKRLWTLKHALHRLGAHTVIVTKKVGQWFGGHMTERFDRVLCDAPCTAQGTARKDSDALDYCSLENIGKMARLQHSLLESAIHAAKVGGTIVYSTCTLTPEENELVVADMLRLYEGQVEVVPPPEWKMENGKWKMDEAIADSHRVQDALEDEGNWPLPGVRLPLVRLWPQTYDTEGFFCAVLRKAAPTRDALSEKWVRFQEEALPRSRQQDVLRNVESQYGTSFVDEGDMLFARGEYLLLATEAMEKCGMPVSDYSLGLPFGKRLPDGRVLVSHELSTLRGMRATQQTIDVTAEEVEALLDGRDLPCDSALRGHMLVRHDGMCIGHSLAKDGKLKNNIPRWIVQYS